MTYQMNLKPGAFLQGGKYKILSVLGQGGFAITYLAEHSLMGRKFCIKEFFIKEYCNREELDGEETTLISLGTINNKTTVERYQEKFLKEARMISRLDHPNIIRIHDVFTENNTAYYVMDYIEGLNLNDIIKQNGPMDEASAIRYIRGIGAGLSHVHANNINHLDVKPGNIMVRKETDIPVLIDFGLSKQYDEAGGQTSTTPIGLSEGFAPLEQYNVGGVETFTPQTDIYSLAATLYFILTGAVPPNASIVMNEGMPGMPDSISEVTRKAIEKGMSPIKKDRPGSVQEFLSMLGYAQTNESSGQVKSDELYNVAISSIKSRIKTIEALTLLGFPEEKAFSHVCTFFELSSIVANPRIIWFASVKEDEAKHAEEVLTQAGCEVCVKKCEKKKHSVTLTSVTSKIKALSVLGELGFTEDEAFSKIMSLPCLIYEEVDDETVEKVKKLLTDAGCEFEIKDAEKAEEKFYDVRVESVSSKLSAIDALTKLGLSEDEAFEKLVNLPSIIFSNVTNDKAEDIKNALSEAGCKVTIDEKTTVDTQEVHETEEVEDQTLYLEDACLCDGILPVARYDLSALWRDEETEYNVRREIRHFKEGKKYDLNIIWEGAEYWYNKRAISFLLNQYANGALPNRYNSAYPEGVDSIEFLMNLAFNCNIRKAKNLLERVQNKIDQLYAEDGEQCHSYDMVKVEGGSFNSFWYGECDVKTFCMGTKLVTMRLWKEIMGAEPRHQQVCLDSYKDSYYPVSYISWYDAQEFINKLNKKFGTQYRLPTAIEWEYAARGGINHDKYKYSGDDDPERVGWFDRYQPHPVGLLTSNSLGLYDMSGNLQEWCDDIVPKGNLRIALGDSVERDDNSDELCTIKDSKRLYEPDDYDKFFGIRLAHDIETYKPFYY